MSAPPSFSARLDALLAEAGLAEGETTPERLAPLDQFHTRGIAATRELAALAALRSGDRVLDVGGGLGGPARALAADIGCAVTVVDRNEDYCRAGARLTRLTRQGERVTHVRGDALRLPVADAAFDVAWTQHAQMNIPDKRRLYAEMRRVLAPGGRLALHDVCAGPAGSTRFPAPWADHAMASYLVPAEDLRAAIAGAGFHEIAWRDETAASAAFMAERADAHRERPAGALSLRSLLGPWFTAAVANQAWNLANGRAAVVLGVFEIRDGARIG